MMMKDWYKAALALVVWRESGGEPMEGKLAVASVIKNRVLATHLPDQWDDVIERKWQFSSMTAPGDPMLVKWPHDGDQSWIDSMAVADRVMDLDGTDNTGGATFYANLDVVPKNSSFWAIVADTKFHPMTVKIGRHTFYK